MSIVHRSESNGDCMAESERNKRALCVSVSLSMTVCDVSIKGNKADHEANVWSLSDTDISNGWLTGNLYC